MTSNWVTAAVALTIPDNEARTAYSTLRRLGVDLAKLERFEMLAVRDGDPGAVESAVRRNEAVFNENTHRLVIGASDRTAPGELWVADDRPVRIRLGAAGDGLRFRAYRLGDRHGNPATAEVVREAAEMLLCNPAFQRRIEVLADAFTGETTL